MRKLPTFKGYKVDFCNQLFRRPRPRLIGSKWVRAVEVVPFKTVKGDRLLSRLIRKAKAGSALFDAVNNYLYTQL